MNKQYFDKHAWETYSENCIRHAWKPEYAAIAERIPCADEILRKVLAIEMPSIADRLDQVRLESLQTLREFLKTEEGEIHYKNFLLYAPTEVRERIW